MNRSRSSLLVTAALLFGLSLGAASACSSEPRFQRCSNGGECERIDPKYAFCLQGRCVECIGRGSCGAHKSCEEGACVESTR